MTQCEVQKSDGERQDGEAEEMRSFAPLQEIVEAEWHAQRGIVEIVGKDRINGRQHSVARRGEPAGDAPSAPNANQKINTRDTHAIERAEKNVISLRGGHAEQLRNYC